MTQALTTDRSFGVIPIHMHDGEARFLLVQHKAGHWGFPKGHADPGETPVQAAERELHEETGLAAVRLIERPSFTESYQFTKRKSGRPVIKQVTYFLGYIDEPTVTPCPKEVIDAAWGDAGATRERISFIEGQALFDEVVAYLSQREA